MGHCFPILLCLFLGPLVDGMMIAILPIRNWGWEVLATEYCNIEYWVRKESCNGGELRFLLFLLPGFHCNHRLIFSDILPGWQYIERNSQRSLNSFTEEWFAAREGMRRSNGFLPLASHFIGERGHFQYLKDPLHLHVYAQRRKGNSSGFLLKSVTFWRVFITYFLFLTDNAALL